MTVAVGTICDGGRAAIIVADRFVGTASWELAVPGPDSKVFRIDDRMMMSFAGNVPDPDFVEQLVKEVGSKSRLSDAVDSLFSGHKSDRLKNQRMAALMTDDIYDDLVTNVARRSELEELRKSLPDTELIVVGADDTECRIYTIGDLPRNRTFPGFAAIGAGAPLAMTAFAKNPNMKNTPLAEAIFQVYFAKQIAAQFCSHISKDTDIGIVFAGGKATTLPRSDVDRLQAICESVKPVELSSEARATLDDVAERIRREAK